MLLFPIIAFLWKLAICHPPPSRIFPSRNLHGMRIDGSNGTPPISLTLLLMLMATIFVTPFRVGLSGILRHPYGIWISGFLGFLPRSSDILHVKLHAIHEGFLLAEQLNYQEVICFINPLHCVDILLTQTPQFHKYATMI
ncbi:hypothetical protein TSUD_212790 [Trifolium subterraneum]|uniref:RNase H type-1 domain-containing protein n=1 Tax=Trifolium subterraneum TaxID=3900 RepID=A0A2Z6N2Q1_TRISU|nr:hypothetical protein TSUD_212790 [Trifolium subterraneum]